MSDDIMAPLREHALGNVRNRTYVANPDGSFSTVRSGSVNHPGLNGGKTTLIPFVWDGKVIDDPDMAAEMAIQSGARWPSFESHEEATRASKDLSNSLRELIEAEGLSFDYPEMKDRPRVKNDETTR